jgi:hypothetical protein
MVTDCETTFPFGSSRVMPLAAFRQSERRGAASKFIEYNVLRFVHAYCYLCGRGPSPNCQAGKAMARRIRLDLRRHPFAPPRKPKP